jgi:cyclopropane-fatty-acyl-phospholipid synthase
MTNTREVMTESAPMYFSFKSRIAKNILMRMAPMVENGRIVLIERDGHTYVFGNESNDFPDVTLYVSDAAFYSSFIYGGDIGAVESYMRKEWDCDDLYRLLRIISRNSSLYEQTGKGWSWVTRPLYLLYGIMHRNTPNGSKKNIFSHYDLGNDFFSVFLDNTLCYSCGIFISENDTLEEASIEKMDRLCRLLDLNPNDRLLEIGTGWGGFALHAAQKYGCSVITTTISKAQYELANKRVLDSGLSDKIKVLLQDYRDLTGRYDKIVSIEMIEAVGHQFLPVYFRKCASLLTDSGRMALQAITIRDHEYENYKNGMDFIKRYIFPGGCLPSLTILCETLTKHTDLRITHVEDIGSHYVRTLLEWHNRFKEGLTRIQSMGYEDVIIRLWEFYFLSCAAAFAEGKISDIQILLSKPDAMRLP